MQSACDITSNKNTIKLVSWNVNGLRACLKKGFMDFFKHIDSDCFCIQETKMRPEQAEIILEGYKQFWNPAERKGYSGTAVFTKMEPLSVAYGISIEHHDNEGRVITLEFEKFYLINVYTPNSKEGLLRLDYRMQWEDDFREYILRLEKIKPVIICGDMNVAHEEIDLKHPKTNRKNAGFTDEERNKISRLLEAGFTDSFRFLHPQKVQYSWWSYRSNARKSNSGWRIDYFLVSEKLKNNITEAAIHDEIYGSDHCPISVIIDK